jgi:hypothetical protein
MDRISQNLNLLFEIVDYAGLQMVFIFECVTKDLYTRITRDSNLGVINFRLRERHYENCDSYQEAKRELIEIVRPQLYQ